MVRFKHRYLLVHLIFPHSVGNPLSPNSDSNKPDDTKSSSTRTIPHLSEAGLISLLRESLSVNFGDIGAGEVGGTFSIKYLSPHTQILIIRVSREHFRTLWAALTLLRKVGGTEVIARVMHVSGTIRKTQHEAMALDRTEILKASKNSAARKGDEALDEEILHERVQQSEKAILEMEA